MFGCARRGSMEVLKLRLEGVTASFRYPHFTWGRQPTYIMPPPSTIYGLICAAVGEWINPAELQFAYQFYYEQKTEDLEHIHAVSEAGGNFQFQGKKYPKNIEGNINPLKREFLYRPQLTLYLTSIDLQKAFLEPRYPLTLGRSQDFLFLLSLETIQLHQSAKVYFEHTILPWEYRPNIQKGLSIMMPRFIDYENDRRVDFSRYIILQNRVFTGANEEDEIPKQHLWLHIKDQEYNFWYDPNGPVIAGANQGVLFHSFIKD